MTEFQDKSFVLELVAGNRVLVGLGGERFMGTVTKVTDTRVKVSYLNTHTLNTIEREFHRLSGKRYGSGDEVGSIGAFYHTRIVSMATKEDERQIKAAVAREKNALRRQEQGETRRQNYLAELQRSTRGLPHQPEAGTQTTSRGGGPDRITGFYLSFNFKTRAEFDAFVRKVREVR